MGPVTNQTQAGAALEAGFLSAAAGVELGRSNCTPVLYSVSLQGSLGLALAGLCFTDLIPVLDLECNDRYARAHLSSSSCATGSRIESSVVPARIRAWLSLRGLFVGDVISRLSRFLGRSLLLPTSSQVSVREARLRIRSKRETRSRLPSVSLRVVTRFHCSSSSPA